MASLLNPVNQITRLRDSLVSQLLDSVLGKYVKSLRDKFKMKLWSGEVEAYSIELKKEALDDLSLPVAVKHGILGHLYLKVPWDYDRESSHIVLSDIVLIVQPLASFGVSSEHDMVQAEKDWQKKKEKLQRHVERWGDQLHRRWTGSAKKKSTGNTLSRIMRLIKVDIYRVHIMLEDEHSHYGHPYTLGLAVDSIRLSPPPNGRADYVDREASTSIKADEVTPVLDISTKKIAIKNLRVYLNSGRICDLPIYDSDGTWREWYDLETQSDRKYMLHRRSGTPGASSSSLMESNARSGRRETDWVSDADSKTSDLIELYEQFGPLLAAQFRLMRSNPNEDIDVTGVGSATEDDTDTVLSSLPILRRKLPGGWVYAAGTPNALAPVSGLGDGAPFSVWSHIDARHLHHIVDRLSGSIKFQQNKGVIERADDPPRNQLEATLKRIQINLAYHQVRHIESFMLYLKRHERFELSRRLGAQANSPRPIFRIATAKDEVRNQNMTELKRRAITVQWWKYAKAVVVSEMREKRGRWKWRFIREWIRRRRTYIDNWKRLQKNTRIWVADPKVLHRLKEVTGNKNVVSLDDPRLQLVAHKQVVVDWPVQAGKEEAEANERIEKDKNVEVKDIMLFQQIGYAELQLEYYKNLRVREASRKSTSGLRETKGDSETNWLWAKFLSANSLSSASYTAEETLYNDLSDTKEKKEEKLSKAEKNRLFSSIHYDVRANKYGILPKEYIMQQVSVVLLHVKVTILTTQSSKVFKTRMQKKESGGSRRTKRKSVAVTTENKSEESDESKEEMFLESMCFHYANGVDADQVDVIVGGINIVDHSTSRLQPKTFFSITKEISIKPTWGWTPTLMSVLRHREKRTAFFKWLETHNQRLTQSRKTNAYTNLKFWIEAEHFRTERHRFGDVSDPQDYDFNLYRSNRTKWADAILNRYIRSRGANKVELSSPEAQSTLDTVMKEFDEIETWQNANKQASLSFQLSNLFVRVQDVVWRELEYVYDEYISAEWIPRYRQFWHWMRDKIGNKRSQSNATLNSLALQIRHQDMLQAEVEIHSAMVPKIETKREEDEDALAKNVSHVHSLSPLVGASATAYALSESIAIAASLSFIDVVMSDAHSFQTGKREKEYEDRPVQQKSKERNIHDIDRKNNPGQLAEWTVKLRVAKTEIDIEPEIVQRIGGFLLSKDNEMKQTHSKLTESYSTADVGLSKQQGIDAEKRRRYMEKKREMKAAELAKRNKARRQSRKLLLDVNIKAVEVLLPVKVNDQLNRNLLLELKVGALIVGSRNSTGEDMAQMSPILYEASETDESRANLLAGDYDMHDIEISRVQMLFWHNGHQENQSSQTFQVKEKFIRKQYAHCETVLYLAKLKLKYYVSNILHHPKWPGDLYDVHIPEVKSAVTDQGCIFIVDWYSHWRAHIDALAEIKKHHRVENRARKARPSYHGGDNNDKVYSTETKIFHQTSSNSGTAEVRTSRQPKSRQEEAGSDFSALHSHPIGDRFGNMPRGEISKLSGLSQEDYSEHLIFKREELLLAFRLDNLNASVTILCNKHEVHSNRQRQMILYLERMHMEQIRWAYRSKSTFRVNGVAVEAQDKFSRGSKKANLKKEKERVFALTSSTSGDSGHVVTKPQIIFNQYEQMSPLWANCDSTASLVFPNVAAIASVATVIAVQNFYDRIVVAIQESSSKTLLEVRRIMQTYKSMRRKPGSNLRHSKLDSSSKSDDLRASASMKLQTDQSLDSMDLLPASSIFNDDAFDDDNDNDGLDGTESRETKWNTDGNSKIQSSGTPQKYLMGEVPPVKIRVNVICDNFAITLRSLDTELSKAHNMITSVVRKLNVELMQREAPEEGYDDLDQGQFYNTSPDIEFGKVTVTAMDVLIKGNMHECDDRWSGPLASLGFEWVVRIDLDDRAEDMNLEAFEMRVTQSSPHFGSEQEITLSLARFEVNASRSTMKSEYFRKSSFEQQADIRMEIMERKLLLVEYLDAKIEHWGKDATHYTNVDYSVSIETDMLELELDPMTIASFDMYRKYLTDKLDALASKGHKSSADVKGYETESGENADADNLQPQVSEVPDLATSVTIKFELSHDRGVGLARIAFFVPSNSKNSTQTGTYNPAVEDLSMSSIELKGLDCQITLRPHALRQELAETHLEISVEELSVIDNSTANEVYEKLLNNLGQSIYGLTSANVNTNTARKKHLLLDIHVPPSELGLPNIIQINAQDIELIYHKRWVDELKHVIQWVLSATKKNPETKVRYRETAAFEFGPPPPVRGRPDRLLVKASGLRISMPRDSYATEMVIFEIEKIRLANMSLSKEDCLGMNGVAMERFSIRAKGFQMSYVGYPRLIGAGDGNNKWLKPNGIQPSKIFDAYHYDCAKPTDKAIMLVRASEARILYDDLASSFDRPLTPVPMRVFIVASRAEAWLPEKVTDALKWLFKANKEEKSHLLDFAPSVRGNPTNMNIKVSIGPNLEVTIFERVDPYPVGYVDGNPRARHLMEDDTESANKTRDSHNQSHNFENSGENPLHKALQPLRKTAKAVSKLAAALASKGKADHDIPAGRNRAPAISDPIVPLALTTNTKDGNKMESAIRRIKELEELNERLQSQLEAREDAHKHRMNELGGILYSLSKRITMACENVIASDNSVEDDTQKTKNTLVPYFDGVKPKGNIGESGSENTQ